MLLLMVHSLSCEPHAFLQWVVVREIASMLRYFGANPTEAQCATNAVDRIVLLPYVYLAQVHLRGRVILQEVRILEPPRVVQLHAVRLRNQRPVFEARITRGFFLRQLHQLLL